jgi:hypothetical protein
VSLYHTSIEHSVGLKNQQTFRAQKSNKVSNRNDSQLCFKMWIRIAKPATSFVVLRTPANARLINLNTRLASQTLPMAIAVLAIFSSLQQSIQLHR